MYAEVVIDILNSKVDRPFTYAVPKALEQDIAVGTAVRVPFGRGSRLRSAYVMKLTSEAPKARFTIKEIDSVDTKAVGIQEQMIMIALKIRHLYGGTIYQALQVVLPAKQQIARNKPRNYVFTGSDEVLQGELDLALRRKYYARIRLLTAFQEHKVLPAEIAADRLSIARPTLQYFLDKGLMKVESREEAPVRGYKEGRKEIPVLNEEQEAAVEGILNEERTVSLLFGITGSGKTEVYLRLIEECLNRGRSAIVLIPEIALTYQTVMRFYERFGDLVSVVHSRLSKGEKFERFSQAEAGRIKVMIGPRSALFTPFSELGLIIMDEFHENSYLSEQVPKYDTAEVAAIRAKLQQAKLVLGSATPSVSSFYRARHGEFGLYRLNQRAVEHSRLPEVYIADMREELRRGNRSVFSEVLRKGIKERLERREQVMLFLNRRGYSGAVSCRNCGKPLLCPHCSIALKYHKNHTLQCHICGYVRPMDRVCPECGSDKIGAFGLGTERLEEMVQEAFPGVRTLRMDADTTSGKEGHREILEKFAMHEADVLIGTQMIVKGHDFPGVTLVGIIAADLSLTVPDYRSSERTFQLLVQAEGRAGRADKPGECVVQTYMPEHYAVQYAAKQDYERFYEAEMNFRSQMNYPPSGAFMGMMLSAADDAQVHRIAAACAEEIRKRFPQGVRFLGPAEAGIYKLKDMFREVLYFKAADEDKLLAVKQALEEISTVLTEDTRVYVSFER